MPSMKPLPHDTQAEQAIFTAMLINEGCRPLVRNELRPSDFYLEKHQALFPVITELDGDLIVLRNELERRGVLEKCGGDSYLAELVDSVSTSAGVKHHITIVKELSRQRAILTLSQRLLDKSGQLSATEMQSYMQQTINALDIRDSFGIKRGVDIGNVFSSAEMLSEYANHIANLQKNRFVLGIPKIDKVVRGVGAGELFFILARAGSFKTAMLQNLLKAYVNHSSWGAVFFSLEMPISSITERYHQIVQGETGREIERFYTSNVDGVDDHRKALEDSFMKALDGLFIVPTRVSVPDIIRYVKLIERERKTKIGVLGIDYLGLMNGEGKGEYEIVSKLARDLKSAAKLLNIPIIALCQTSRRGGTGETEIEMDMARGSGAIEEAADFILGLFQYERSRRPIEGPGTDQELICKILKNRKGPKGSKWKLDLDPETLRIGPDAEKWEPPKGNKSNGKGFQG